VQAVEDATVVTLRERHYADTLVDLESDFSVTSAEITKGETIDLRNLTYLVPGTYAYNGIIYPITKDELTWTITSGVGTLSGSEFTGSSVGMATVKVTLPADKNNTVEISRNITINVKDPPQNPGYTFTLRIIRPNTPDQIDSINQVVLVPVYNDTYSETVHVTGYTGVRWNYSGKYINSVAKFKELYPDNGTNLYYTLSNNSAGDAGVEDDWADIVVPWPTGGVTGYYIFFVESDGHVRSYCKAATKPSSTWRYPPESDFLFFIHPDDLFGKKLFVQMYAAKADGYKQAPVGIGVLTCEVIPIGYDDIDNVATIMLSNGVGNRLDPHYPDDITRWFK
jgi:hypothetical protein